ncbi:hypothetical protein F4677DRAFT_458789 [Hypoxylon crocopeplum]|nr:hypothetical protein F4677DRAFT_458789 [Hypoxylon crocopeplum]
MTLAKFFSSLQLLLLFLSSAAVAFPATQFNESSEAIETDLIKRRPGDESHPIDAEFDTTGWPLSAEFNCYIMLCVLNTRKYRKNVQTSSRKTHYIRSGAYFQPFANDHSLDVRHAYRLDDDTTSAEEFPWESLEQGGPGAHVFPTTRDEQQSQATALGSRFRSTRNVTPIREGDWIKIKFTGYPSGGYCAALFGGLPRGVTREAFCRDRSKEENIAGHPSYHMQDYDQVLNPANHQFYRYSSGKRDEPSGKRDADIVNPPAEVVERGELVDRDEEFLAEDDKLVKRDDADAEDMCVPKPDGGNTCD